MPYWELFYHVVWSTAKREPTLTGRIRGVAHEAVREIARRHNYIVHAVGGVEDHVHVLVSIPPAESIADAVGRLKGGSSKMINDRTDLNLVQTFAWQSDYSVHSFARKDLEAVQKYVDAQPHHHARNRLHPQLEPGETGQPGRKRPG